MLKVYLSPTVRHAVKTRRGFCRLLGLDKAFVGFESLDCAKDFGKQRGFSLLELILVLGLLSIIAIGSVTMLVDDGDWKRQDETEKRWDAIRKAIIGEPNLSLNGSPYVAGYVADMGRLPRNISELFLQGTQPDWAGVELYKKTAATNCTTTPDDCYWLHGGWRGPYLYTAGSAQYRDAWNNQDANAAEDVVNFGWNVSLDGLAPDYTDISVKSLGSDNAPNGTEYNQDFPLDPNQTTVSLNEWTLSAGTPLTFNIRFNKPVPLDITNLTLHIYRYTDNTNNTVTFADDITDELADNPFDLNLNDVLAPSQTLTPLTELPIGRFAAVIRCPSNDVYDGDCTTPNNSSPVYFTLTANTNQVTISWNLP